MEFCLCLPAYRAEIALDCSTDGGQTFEELHLHPDDEDLSIQGTPQFDGKLLRVWARREAYLSIDGLTWTKEARDDLHLGAFPRRTPEQLDEQVGRIKARVDAGNWPTPRRKVVVADRESDVMLGHVSWYRLFMSHPDGVEHLWLCFCYGHTNAPLLQCAKKRRRNALCSMLPDKNVFPRQSRDSFRFRKSALQLQRRKNSNAK